MPSTTPSAKCSVSWQLRIAASGSQPPPPPVFAPVPEKLFMSDVRAQRRLRRGRVRARTGGSQQTSAGDADEGQPAGVHVRGPTPPGLVLNQTKRSQTKRSQTLCTDCVRSPADGDPLDRSSSRLSPSGFVTMDDAPGA